MSKSLRIEQVENGFVITGAPSVFSSDPPGMCREFRDVGPLVFNKFEDMSKFMRNHFKKEE